MDADTEGTPPTSELPALDGTGIATLELERIAESVADTNERTDETLFVGAALVVLLIGVAPRDAEPGWLNPGKPPELAACFVLIADCVAEGVADAVAEARDVLPSSGEYVNMGACRLVSLVVPFLTTAIELVAATAGALLEGNTVLLSAGLASGLGVADGVGDALELSCRSGLGVGVMNDVETTVCGSSVASGSPFVSWNVIAGSIDVKTDCWIGSTTTAVSALTDCELLRGSVEEEERTNVEVWMISTVEDATDEVFE